MIGLRQFDGVGSQRYGQVVSSSSGSISLRLAMSLDGYIADEDGNYDWIVPVPSPTLDTVDPLPFEVFLDDIDVVVMGRNCYDQGQHRDYAELGKRLIVATSSPPVTVPGEGFVEFVSEDVVGTVRAARDEGQRCFLFGGGRLVETFLASNLVDELTVGIVPVLLGKGRPLFGGRHPQVDLALKAYAVLDGKVRLVYRRR